MPITVFPSSVGGSDDFQASPRPTVKPIEDRAANLVFPASVGGDAVAPTQEAIQAEPIQEAPAQPLSELIPQAAAAVGEAVESIKAPATGIGDIFTGSERIEATPELGTLPEFGPTPEGNTFKIALGLLSTADPKAQIEMIQSAIPEAVFETTADGSTIIEVPTEEGGTRRSVLNRPGFSPQDLTTSIAQVLAFVPAARLATFGKTLLKKFGLGVIGAGATEQALQETGVEFLGRETRDPKATAISAVAGGAGELIVPAVQAVRQGRQAAKIGAERTEVAAAKESIKPAQEAVAGIKEATGAEVGLFQAQQTQIPSDLLKQRILPQLDAGSRKAASSLEAQNKEAFEATSELINTIAGPETVSAGAGKFRTASQLAIDSAKQSRTTATKGLYKEALDEGAKVNLGSTKELIKDMLNEAPKGSDFERVGRRLENLIKPLKKGETPSLRQLQKSKQAMQDIVDTVGDKAVSGPIKFDVVTIKRELVDQMSDASPLFRAAEDEFIRLSPAVKELEDSILGAASKVKDIDLQNISSRIFARNSNPETVRNAKKLIDSVDPEAWNVMLRGELQKRFGGIETLAEDLSGELIGNIPGQLRSAIFGNPEQRRTLLAAMNTDQRKNFVYLDEVLRRASSGRQAGSPTASFGAALDKLRGVGGVLRDVIFRPLETLQKTGESGLFDRNVAALTEVLFDPKFKPQLSKLRKLDPNSPAAGRALTQLLDDITITEENE